MTSFSLTMPETGYHHAGDEEGRVTASVAIGKFEEYAGQDGATVCAVRTDEGGRTKVVDCAGDMNTQQLELLRNIPGAELG